MLLSRLSLSVLLGLVLPGALTVRAQSLEPLMINFVVLRPLVEAETPARHVGVLAAIGVDEGASVARGDVLASLDDRLAKLNVRHAEVERDQAKQKVDNDLRLQYADKALEVARAELQRSIESNEQFPNSISKSQLDVERLTVDKLTLERKQAERDMESDRFELQMKENALAVARLELELHSVRAPFAGMVALVRGRPGEWVQPGAPVVRLVAIDRLRAWGFAPAAAADALKLGAAVRFTPETTDQPAAGGAAPQEFAGEIGFISPEIDPATHQVRVWARIDNPDHRLRPGQQGKMQIMASTPVEASP